MNIRHRMSFLIAIALAATAATAAEVNVQLPILSKTIDPCTVATAAQLQLIIAPALNSAFPIVKERPGKKITLSEPELVSLKCLNPLTVEVRAKIRYRDTRGLDQGQASGSVRFTAKIRGKVGYTGIANGPVTKANFKSAKACMSDFNIVNVNINNVPNWLDNSLIKDMLNANLSNSKYCVDITNYVALFLQNGGTL